MVINNINFFDFQAKSGGTIVLDNRSNLDATLISI